MRHQHSATPRSVACRWARWLPAVLIGLTAAAAPRPPQDPAGPTGRPQDRDRPVLTVATKVSPPFSIRDEVGTWSGISIELWEAVADDLDFDIRYREMELGQMFPALETGEIDAAVAAISITAEREARIDFTHGYFASGLGIAAPTGGQSYMAAVRGLLSLAFLKLVVLLLAILAGIGLVVWFFERKRNAAQFGGSVVRGMGAGLWWSAVTMTTVGYGDKAPITFPGRIIGLIWMFASLLAISAFTASIASVITVAQLETSINGPEDLNRAIAGTVRNSTSQQYLRDRHIPANLYDTADDGVRAVSAGLIEAFVYDRPILRFLANRDATRRVQVLPAVFEQQQYGFALPAGSPWREPINQAMLEVLDSGRWDDILGRYLGE